MQGASDVLVSRGPWIDHGGRDAIELLWEDGSNTPFCLHLVAEQCDRLVPETEQGGGFVVAAWSRDGIEGSWPEKYRCVSKIPYLAPWVSN